MASSHKDIVAFGLLAVCIVGFIAAWHSPDMKLDAGIVLVAVAFAGPFYWPGHWSQSLLIRVAFTAYFFRCVVLYLAGTDAVKKLAFGDIFIGLAGVGGVYLVSWITARGTGPIESAKSMRLVSPGDAAKNEAIVGEGAAGDDEINRDEADEPLGQPTEPPVTVADRGTSLRSPLQFGMKTLFILTLACAGFFTVAAAVSLGVALLVLLLSLVWLLLAGFTRLVRFDK